MLATDRLILREWQQEDLVPFSRLNADKEVMRFFPAVQSMEETRVSVERVTARIKADGFGFWAAELRNTSTFIGFIGLQRVQDALPCAPAVEIGWRLDRSVWGQGLAPEGARACLAYAFSALGLDEVVSFTATANKPSRSVMEKIGMTHDLEGDFDHPAVAESSGLRQHVLYRMNATDPIGL